MLSPAKPRTVQPALASPVATRNTTKHTTAAPPQQHTPPSHRKPPLSQTSKTAEVSPTQSIRSMTAKMSLADGTTSSNDENTNNNKQPALASPTAKKTLTRVPSTSTPSATPVLRRTRSKPDMVNGIATAITAVSPATQRKYTTPVHSQVNASPIASASPTAKRSVAKLSAALKQAVEEPPTPSKIIFSPQYHDEHANATEKQALKNKPMIKPALKPVKTSAEVAEDEFDPFLFIKHLPPLSQYQIKRIVLPQKTSVHKVTLALDLDETLVHCSVQPIDIYDFTFTVNFNGIDYTVYVRVRPYLTEFLQAVSEWFEIVIFTASQRVYADKLLNILDPKGVYIHHRIFRDSCTVVEGNYLKDLTVLGRSMNALCLIDNSIQAFAFQLDNGIPIESWFDDKQDTELLNMLPFLEQMRYCNDVRPYIRNTFKLQEYVDSL